MAASFKKRFPDAIEELISEFSKFPSVGPKTAERYIFYLLNQQKFSIENLIFVPAVLILQTKNILNVKFVAIAKEIKKPFVLWPNNRT
jgi:hypothetical protein